MLFLLSPKAKNSPCNPKLRYEITKQDFACETQSYLQESKLAKMIGMHMKNETKQA